MSETGASLGGQPQRKFAGAGGTPGGVGEFFIGLGLAAIGFYLLFNHVYVQTSFGHPSGFGVFGNSFGLTVLPLLFGIGTLFVNGKSILGWALTAGGLLFIAAGILMNMHIYFRATTLFDALVMFGLIAAGFGLIVKSLRPHKGSESTNSPCVPSVPLWRDPVPSPQRAQKTQRRSERWPYFIIFSMLATIFCISAMISL